MNCKHSDEMIKQDASVAIKSFRDVLLIVVFAKVYEPYISNLASLIAS